MVMQGPTKNTDGCPGSGHQSGCRLWLALSALCSLLSVMIDQCLSPTTGACFGSWNRFPSRRDAAVQTPETCCKPRSVVGHGACVVVVDNIEAPICPTWIVCCCCSMLWCVVGR